MKFCCPLILWYVNIVNRDLKSISFSSLTEGDVSNLYLHTASLLAIASWELTIGSNSSISP